MIEHTFNLFFNDSIEKQNYFISISRLVTLQWMHSKSRELFNAELSYLNNYE